MSDDGKLEYEKVGHVGKITFNRPQALNALTAQGDHPHVTTIVTCGWSPCAGPAARPSCRAPTSPAS
jgi:hypothetical protein